MRCYSLLAPFRNFTGVIFLHFDFDDYQGFLTKFLLDFYYTDLRGKTLKTGYISLYTKLFKVNDV